MNANVFQTALAVQDACNTMGVIGTLAKIREHIIDHDPEWPKRGEPYIRSHPAIVLVLNKLVDMTQADGITTFGTAYDQCKRLAEANAVSAVLPVYYVFPNGDTPTLTEPQRKRLDEIVVSNKLGDRVEISPMFMGQGAVLIQAAGMTIGVLPDGSSHS